MSLITNQYLFQLAKDPNTTTGKMALEIIASRGLTVPKTEPKPWEDNSLNTYWQRKDSGCGHEAVIWCRDMHWEAESGDWEEVVPVTYEILNSIVEAWHDADSIDDIDSSMLVLEDQLNSRYNY